MILLLQLSVLLSALALAASQPLLPLQIATHQQSVGNTEDLKIANNHFEEKSIPQHTFLLFHVVANPNDLEPQANYLQGINSLVEQHRNLKADIKPSEVVSHKQPMMTGNINLNDNIITLFPSIIYKIIRIMTDITGNIGANLDNFVKSLQSNQITGPKAKEEFSLEDFM